MTSFNTIAHDLREETVFAAIYSRRGRRLAVSTNVTHDWWDETSAPWNILPVLRIIFQRLHKPMPETVLLRIIASLQFNEGISPNPRPHDSFIKYSAPVLEQANSPFRHISVRAGESQLQHCALQALDIVKAGYAATNAAEWPIKSLKRSLALAKADTDSELYVMTRMVQRDTIYFLNDMLRVVEGCRYQQRCREKAHDFRKLAKVLDGDHRSDVLALKEMVMQEIRDLEEVQWSGQAFLLHGNQWPISPPVYKPHWRAFNDLVGGDD